MLSPLRLGWSPRAIVAAVAAVLVLSTAPLTEARADDVSGIDLDGTGSLSGVVLNDSGLPVAGVTVALHGLQYRQEYDVWQWGSSLYSTTAADGSYTFAGRAAGTYAIGFSCPNCTIPYLTEWWNDQFEQLKATRIELAGGEHKQGLDAVISTGAAVSGRVTATDGAALPGVRVRVWNQVNKYRESQTDVSGDYRIDRLLPGTYRLQFIPPTGSPFAGEWHEGAYRDYNATPFDLAKDQRLSSMDATLEQTGSISGIVRGEHGDPIDAIVTFIPAGGFIERYASSLGSKGYSFENLPPGRYRLSFEDDAVDDGYLTEWWRDKPWEVADWVEVAEGEHISGIDADLAKQRVVIDRLVLSTMTPVVGAPTTAILDSPNPGVAPEYQWFAGTLAIPGATSASFVPQPEHLGVSLRVRVVATAPGFSPVMREAYAGRVGSPVARLAGADRYSTSVAVSASRFQPGVPVAYIASGLNFPDALSGAPLAGIAGGPVLLTAPDALPDLVAAELQRLRPEHIVILGGTAVITETVQAQLDELTAGSTRLAGADRYETSALISASQFEPGVPVAYIASGLNFPDALSGAPLAGLTGGPILLTAPDALPDVVAAELQRLQPGRIVILGGTAVINPSVQARLDELTAGSPTRLAGADRYETSALISASQFQPGVPVAYIASGLNFPDALSGAPLAGIAGGPVLLTAPDALPDVVAAELQRLRPERIVILGGTAVITQSVQAQLDQLTSSD